MWYHDLICIQTRTSSRVTNSFRDDDDAAQGATAVAVKRGGVNVATNSGENHQPPNVYIQALWPH